MRGRLREEQDNRIGSQRRERRGRRMRRGGVDEFLIKGETEKDEGHN